MAARENQGLQIALIIFAILTVALIVTTFVFFNYYKETRVERDQARNAATAAEKKAAEATNEATEMKNMIGIAADKDLAALKEAFTKDMAAYAKSFPEAK